MACSRVAVTYWVAKELANILKPLVGTFPHHIKNAQAIVEQVKNSRLEIGECITSYDVKGPFPSVPVDPAISIIKHKLEQDTELHNRTSMSITTSVHYWVSASEYLFQDKYSEQVHSTAMGSPMSPIVANLFMEEFEINSST